jgi:hypothetical protein
MTSPWDDRQKPHEKSPHHGKRDADDGAHGGHGTKEHGLGGQLPPGLAKKLIQEVEDPNTDVPEEEGETLAGASEPLAAAAPPSFLIPNRPPILDQGTTPRCVSFYSATDQNQHDRPEIGKFVTFDTAKFATRIGTTSQGASITRANTERVDRGYPVVALGDAGKHRIRRAVLLEKKLAAIKAALQLGHGVGLLMPWFHSWFHPLASGKLPAPDYLAGYHMIFDEGWDDSIGLWLRNSWGTDWGKGGRCALPYAQIGRAVQVQRTVDV